MSEPQKKWKVVCLRYVSAGFDTKDAAQNHLIATKDINKNCTSPHQVQLTDLPYGSRVSGEYSA